jgi:hypothetical protein
LVGHHVAASLSCLEVGVGGVKAREVIFEELDDAALLVERRQGHGDLSNHSESEPRPAYPVSMLAGPTTHFGPLHCVENPPRVDIFSEPNANAVGLDDRWPKRRRSKARTWKYLPE